MLNGSILGALYRCWLSSGILALLQKIWRPIAAAFRGSRILGFLFGPPRLDGYYSNSLYARFFRKLMDVAAAICRAVVAAARGSAVCRGVAPAVRTSKILNYELLFGLFCCVMFVVPHDNWNNLYAVIAAAVFFALHLLRCAAAGRKPAPPDTLGLGFALFVLSCVLSPLFSPTRSDSVRILALFFAGFVFCWLVATGFDEPRSLRRLMGWLYLGMLAVGVYAVMQRVLDIVDVNSMYTDVSINRGVPGRVYASLDNPNNLSGYLQMFLPLGAAYAAGAGKGWQRVLLALGLLIPAAALVMTYSRAGWIAVMLAAAVYIYFRERKLLPALIVLAALAVPLLPASVLTRLSTISNSRETSRNHRLAIWTGVVRLLADKGQWLTGIGLGPDAFQAVYPDYYVANGMVGAYQSQMLYLELILEMGILGFLSFLWMTLKYVGRIGRAIAAGGGGRENRLVLAAGLSSFAALAVSSVVEYLWFYQRLIFGYFIWFGVILAALRIAERGEIRRDQEAAP